MQINNLKSFCHHSYLLMRCPPPPNLQPCPSLTTIKLSAVYVSKCGEQIQPPSKMMVLYLKRNFYLHELFGSDGLWGHKKGAGPPARRLSAALIQIALYVAFNKALPSAVPSAV